MKGGSRSSGSSSSGSSSSSSCSSSRSINKISVVVVVVVVEVILIVSTSVPVVVTLEKVLALLHQKSHRFPYQAVGGSASQAPRQPPPSHTKRPMLAEKVFQSSHS